MRILVSVLTGLLVVGSSFGEDTKIDVSRVIDKSDAILILGDSVRDPSPRSGEGEDGYYSKCNYYGVHGAKSLVIRLHIPNAGSIDAQKQLQMLAATNGEMQNVLGLGDTAQTFSSGGETGVASRLLMLYVVKGNTFVMVGLGGFADDLIALAKAKAVAQKILDHL